MAGLVTHTRSRNLWFRQVVPERHRSAIGRSEIKLSLGTSEPALAKVKHAVLQAEWRQRFLALDQKIEDDEVARAPALVARGLRKMTSGSLDNTVLAITKFLAFRLVTSWGPEFYGTSDAEYVFLGVPDDDAFCETAGEADLVAPEDRLAFVASMRAHERTAETQGMGYRRAAVRLLESRRWSLVEPEVMLLEGVTGTSIRRGSPLFDAVAEALLVALTQHRFECWDEGSLAAFPLETGSRRLATATTSSSTLAFAPAVAVTGLALSPLSDGLVHWRNMQAPAHQSDLEVTRSVDRFIELFGDMAVGAITTRHILDYRDLIAIMPRHLQLEKIHAAGRRFVRSSTKR